MEKQTLQAFPREDLRKTVTRRLRREGQIPAIVYGDKPVTLSINAREFNKKFSTVSENTLITLSIEGKKKSYDVLIKDYQDDIVTSSIQHIDFMEIQKGKTLKTHVPIHLEGNAKGVRDGGLLEHVLHELEVECLPKDLPGDVVVDVTELESGHAIHVGDIKAPKGVKFLNPSDQVVATIGSGSKATVEVATEETEEEVAAE